MNRHFPALILCVCGLSLPTLPLSARPEKPVTTVANGKRGSHCFQLRFVTGPFRRASHKTRVTKYRRDDDDLEMRWIDGKPEWNKGGSKNWYGTDGGFPDSEIYSFQVTVDGRRWLVPPRLWSDCYEPNLRTTKPRTFWTQLSPHGKKLTFGMYGSDGAGAYYVLWFLRADGRHSRTFRSTEEAWKWRDR
jgi:hypothetical protein